MKNSKQPIYDIQTNVDEKKALEIIRTALRNKI
jgi:hypothetical protein